ncbi:unnamed protein product [Mesocestoides corti]|uniref:LIM zinc-binding domain-containing protein n=1 Tax=Mesocestoides corti TaxID=53468 RepID=A0A0R3U5S2_MESCO|nr:unnamed protein product [Mesocestoides corti]
MGKSYHPGCFRCVICNKCMDGEPFTVDQSGQVYCLFDYYLVTAPTCAACANPILPVLVKRHFDPKPTEEVIRVVAMNKEFHVECYRCEDCDLLLSDETNSRCYPYTETAENGSPGRTHLLCLKCHLTRIGATPAPGQNVELQRRRGSNGSSSIASSSDLGGPGSSSPSRVYSPTPTSSGLALIGSAEGNAGSPGGVSSPAYKVTRPWGAGQGVPGRPSYLKNDGR